MTRTELGVSKGRVRSLIFSFSLFFSGLKKLEGCLSVESGERERDGGRAG